MNRDDIVVIILNILFTATCTIMILWPLTFTQVPVEAVHNWYGKDLHTYLVFTHAMATGLWLFGEGLINTLWFISDKNA